MNDVADMEVSNVPKHSLAFSCAILAGHLTFCLSYRTYTTQF